MVKKLILLLILLFLHVIPATLTAEETLRCIVFDAGEGQSVLLQKGIHGILFDTGHFGTSFATLGALERYGVKTLDGIFLTHLHPDHASGIFTIMEHFPETVIYESGHRLPSAESQGAYRWVAEALDSRRWKISTVHQGDVLDFHGVRIKILWPEKPEGTSLNDQSLVVVMEYEKRSILLMGDAGKKQEKMLLQKKMLPENVDLLIVGHHGAQDTTSEAFLQHVTPRSAVISINKNNIHGYPDNDVMTRLEKRDVSLFITFVHGDFVWNVN